MPELEKEKTLGHDLHLQIYQMPGIEWGTTLVGMLDGYEFEAFVIPEPSPCPGWGLGDGKLLSLEVRRWIDDQQVFLWDRGPEVSATDERTTRIVDFVVRGLSTHADDIDASCRDVLARKQDQHQRESHEGMGEKSDHKLATPQGDEEQHWMRALSEWVKAEKLCEVLVLCQKMDLE